ncbi:MAG: TlpA disulfide reductase family protein [Planctomycetota bacterium]|nr:TlpA disulfide reductase family protein [Planctomycetota bacterium]
MTIRNTVFVLLFAVFCSELVAEDPMRLRLHDGSFANGQIVPSEIPASIGWKSKEFREPFHFDLATLRSVSLVENPPIEDGKRGLFEFETKNRASVSGRLVGINETHVEIENEILGRMLIDRQQIARMRDRSFAGKVVYQGPIAPEDWSVQKPEQWEFIAGALVSKSPESTIVGKVGMPAKARVDLSIAWEGAPDFVLSLGTTATNKVSSPEDVPAAARLEVWDQQLVLIRNTTFEGQEVADVTLVADIDTTDNRMRLTVLVDQESGDVIVCDAHGRPLDSVSIASSRKTIRNSVHLSNFGPSLTVESFEVREWDGNRRIAVGSVRGTVLDSDKNVINGTIQGYDAKKGVFFIATEGSEVELPLLKLRRGDFAVPEQEGAPSDAEGSEGEGSEDKASEEIPGLKELNQEGDATEKDEKGIEQKELEIVLLDRSRFVATMSPSKDALVFSIDGFSKADGTDQFSCQPKDLRGLIGRTKRFIPSHAEKQLGTMKIGATQLSGFMLSDSPAESETAIFWQPLGSRNASELLADTSGAVIYRAKLPPRKAPVVAQNAQPQRAGIVNVINAMMVPGKDGRKGEVVGEGKPSTDGTKEGLEISFRTGDSITGVVESIDENGLKFASAQTETTFAAHDQVQSVWLNRQKSGPKFTEKLLERLKTIPRRLKDDPPTHLFQSIYGDYLRGRLVSLQNGVLTVEIRLEVQEIAAEQISQIVWLHDRKWDEGEEEDVARNEAELPPFRVHAIGSLDRGITFEPEKVAGNQLFGRSSLLGACSVEIGDLNQLIFGRNIGESVREYNDDPWILALAQYPKVYLDDGEGGVGDPNSGKDSALVGNAAPAFGLEKVGGDRFVLDENRDRVVVLDFWASWCGPCMQTMPLVEEVVTETGVDKVNLVAVNLQENENRISAAIKRLDLKNATVLMDRDGEVAAAYKANAIPQTVIINKKGLVTHVFVGGGARFVANFRAALNEVLGIADEAEKPAS